MNARESENYLAISRSSSASKRVEIGWAEIYRGRLLFRAESSLIQSNCRTNEHLLDIKRKGDPEVLNPFSYVRYHWNSEPVCVIKVILLACFTYIDIFNLFKSLLTYWQEFLFHSYFQFINIFGCIIVFKTRNKKKDEQTCDPNKILL
jgi:hypothetical protein